MAALRKTDKAHNTQRTALSGRSTAASTKIVEYARNIYKSTGGATDELRRVHNAYVQNQKKLAAKS